MLYYLTPNRKSLLVLTFLLFGKGGRNARPSLFNSFRLYHRRIRKFGRVGDTLEFGQVFGGCP